MKTPSTIKSYTSTVFNFYGGITYVYRQLKINRLKHIGLSFCLMMHFSGKFFAQDPCEVYNPCIEYSGPIFPGGTTLCDAYSGFTPDYTIPNGTYASNLNLTLWPYNSSNLAFNNVEILIQGTFYINTPVAFMNCRVKLYPGAQIIVTGIGETPALTEIFSFRSKFFSCSEMWKGIVIASGNRARFYSSYIEDAQYALTVADHVSLTLLSNHFNRNFVGITNAAGNPRLPLLLCKNNIFECTSALNDYYDLDFECCDEDLVSFAGILLNNCSSSISFFDGGNHFNNLNYGILANNSSVNIKGCTFTDAQRTTVIPDLVQGVPLGGAGVVGINSNVFIIGNAENTSCWFMNADLLTLGTNLSVSFAKFEDSNIGVSDSYAGQTVTIEDNSFSSIEGVSTVGVKRSAASGAETHTHISRNMFTHSSTYYPLFFIHISGVLNPTDFAIVDFDTIKFFNPCMDGIRFTGFYSENTLISNNLIQMDGRDNGIIGIHPLLGKTKGSIINDNEIDGGIYYDAFNNSFGILTLASSGIEYCHNKTGQLGYGLAFTGDCDNSNVSQNDINLHGIGLYLTNGVNGVPGLFGVQKGTLNEWLPDSDSYDKFAASYESLADIEFSFYLVDDGDVLLDKYNPHNVNPSTGWFRSYSDGHNLCEEILPFVSGFDSLIITEDSFFENLADAIRFYLEKNLIALILDNEDLIDDYTAYLASMKYESEYLIAKAEIDIKKALQMDLTDQEDLDDLLDGMAVEFDRIATYDNYNYLNIDSTTFTEGLRLDSITAILGRCNNIAVSQQTIKDARTTSLNSDLSDISDDLGDITPRAEYDDYYKTINSLFIKKIVEGNLSLGDYEDLNLIAHDDEDSSFANITALSLFDLCSDHPFPDYTNIGEEIEPYTKNIETGSPLEAIDKIVSFIENGNDLSVVLDIKLSGYLNLYDISGRLVYVKKFTDEQGTYKLAFDLIPGIYYWKISDLSQQAIYQTGVISINQ